MEKLLKGLWGNKYFCKMVLFDHLRECIQKDNYLKATDSKDTEALDKELMDLKIILDLYFNDRKELEKKRIEKFIQKME